MAIQFSLSLKGNRACQQEPEMDPYAVTGQPGKPACEHTDMEPEHGWFPNTATASTSMKQSKNLN